MKVRQQTRFVYKINLILPHHTQEVKAESLLRTKWAQTRLLNPSMKMIPSPRAMIFILRVIPPSNAVANPNTFGHYSAATSAQQIWPRAQHHGAVAEGFFWPRDAPLSFWRTVRVEIASHRPFLAAEEVTTTRLRVSWWPTAQMTTTAVGLPYFSWITHESPRSSQMRCQSEWR